jgi:hypothetical protein
MAVGLDCSLAAGVRGCAIAPKLDGSFVPCAQTGAGSTNITKQVKTSRMQKSLQLHTQQSACLAKMQAQTLRRRRKLYALVLRNMPAESSALRRRSWTAAMGSTNIRGI